MEDQRFYLRRTREKSLYEVIDASSGKRITMTKSDRDYIALLIEPTTKPSEKALYKVLNRFGSERLIAGGTAQRRINVPGRILVRLR